MPERTPAPPPDPKGTASKQPRAGPHEWAGADRSLSAARPAHLSRSASRFAPVFCFGAQVRPERLVPAGWPEYGVIFLFNYFVYCCYFFLGGRERGYVCVWICAVLIVLLLWGMRLFIIFDFYVLDNCIFIISFSFFCLFSGLCM